MDITTIGDFYGTTAQISFVLLGLWWAVVEFRHRALVGDAPSRRMAYLVALHFTLLGTMSLVAMLTPVGGALWNMAFVIGGVAGAVAGVAAVVALGSQIESMPWIWYAAHAAMVPLYALVVMVAAVSAPIAALLGAPALAVEAVLVSLLLLAGVHLAWLVFVRTPAADST